MAASPALLLARLAARAAAAGPDADLLARFRDHRDEAAFAELVRRHGPAVYRVCRRLTGPAAADDAFQATFLVLATRARSVRQPGAVGGWLVGIAGRVARQMRAAHLRRRRHEAAFGSDPDRWQSDDPLSHDLADQFRVLDEAKRLLRARLERRGVVPAVAAALAAGAGEAATAVPIDLGPRTVAAVFDFLAGGAATTAVLLRDGNALSVVRHTEVEPRRHVDRPAH